MKNKLQEQIERAQTLSDNPKKRFFRIYFRGCQYLFIDSGVRIADPE
jgi:cyclopropane fatty-acyl-phospholipid synthase-like methyltransferase